MVWQEQRNHSDDGYFSLVNIKGTNGKNWSKQRYHDLASTRRPVPHSKEILVPCSGLPQHSPKESDALAGEKEKNYAEQHDSDFQGPSSATSGFSQTKLNDPIRNLSSKDGIKIVSSQACKQKLTVTGTKTTVYYNREEEFLPFFTKENDFAFCSNVQELLIKLGIREYTPHECWLFIDSSKCSLKCVLLHNRNT